MRDVFRYFIDVDDDNDMEETQEKVITPGLLQMIAMSLDEDPDPDLAEKMVEVADIEGKGFVTEEDFMNIMHSMGMY